MKIFDNIQKLDMAFLKKIQQKICRKSLDPIMKTATYMGTAGMVWLAAGCAMMATKKHRKAGFVLCAALFIDVVGNNLVVKNVTGRPRPCDIDKSVELKIKRPVGSSMPSGHTLTSVTAATILLQENPLFGLAAVPTAALISFSRMYLFVHYPSDVMAGTLLGIGVGCSATQIKKMLPGK